MLIAGIPEPSKVERFWALQMFLFILEFSQIQNEESSLRRFGDLESECTHIECRASYEVGLGYKAGRVRR